MSWKTPLAYITGTVYQELLLRNEYLVTENRILRTQLKGRVRLNDGERKVLAEIGQKLGKKALEAVAHIVKPDTILAWHRKLIADFFTTEVWTTAGLVTYYVLFFIHLASRKVHVAGVTPHPDQRWMIQIARNVTMVDWGFLTPRQYLIHDRDGKYCPAFQQIIDAAGVTHVPLPPRSPHLHAYAERWVRSVKDEALSRMILFGERSLWYTLQQYVDHYHTERPHQGKGNMILMPAARSSTRDGPLHCRQRLGGLLKYYHRDAA